jgi:VanZ family protein
MNCLSYSGRVSGSAPLSTRARALILVALTCAAILYGSFYPWKLIHPGPGGWRLFWDQRHPTHEFVLNIVLYIPVGFLIFAVTRSVPVSITAAFLLSGFIEGVQPFFDREARARDLAANTAGAAAGAMTAFVACSIRRGVWLPSAPLAILSIWAFHQLYPFVHGLMYPYYGLSSFARMSPGAFAESFVDWLAAFTLAACALPNRSRIAVLCAAVILPARTVLLGMRSPGVEWIAWACAALISIALGPLLVRAPRWVGAALAVTLLARELAPYHLASAAAPFHFRPMEAILSADWFFAVLIITHKAFVYAALIYLLGPRNSLVPTTAAVSACLALLESLQRYLPGRVPDITDPLLAVFLGFAVVLLPPARTLETKERDCST